MKAPRPLKDDLVISSGSSPQHQPWTITNQLLALEKTGLRDENFQYVRVEFLGGLSDLKMLNSYQDVSVKSVNNDPLTTVGYSIGGLMHLGIYMLIH